MVIVLECLKGNSLLIPKKAKSINIGYMAGYIRKADMNSPFIKNKAERCKPQPGQSMPNNCFVKQGSI
jgi:hypothetical protein